MPLDLASLQPGHRFGPYDVSISPEHAADYAAAVGGAESPDYFGAAPPVAIIAAGLSRLISDLGLADGKTQTVHAGQEVEIRRPVQPGEKIQASAVLKSNSLRRDNRFATVSTEFTGGAGETVAIATSTIIVSA